MTDTYTPADRDRATQFFENWPHVSIPDYLPAALAEAFAAHREAAYQAGLLAGAKAMQAAAVEIKGWQAEYGDCKVMILRDEIANLDPAALGEE